MSDSAKKWGPKALVDPTTRTARGSDPTIVYCCSVDQSNAKTLRFVSRALEQPEAHRPYWNCKPRTHNGLCKQAQRDPMELANQVRRSGRAARKCPESDRLLQL